jgi:K+-transporting ATPase A subunit
VSILFLCVIDALLTLRLLDQGAYEINPVMAYFLKFGPYTFFITKYLLTIIPAICLLMFGNIVLRLIKSTRSVLYAMAVFYLAVVVMQLYLVSNVASSPDLKLPPKMLTDTQIVCRMDTPNHHPVPKILLKA